MKASKLLDYRNKLIKLEGKIIRWKERFNEISVAWIVKNWKRM